MFKPVKTPCVGVCSTGIGDQVCRGCKRYVHEVVNWNAYTNEQRYIIAQRLEGFLAQVVSNKLRIVDERQLLAAVEHQQIMFNRDQDAYCWVFSLLKAGASQIHDLAVYGLAYQPDWQGRSLVDVRHAIDQDFYTLSCAYYDRYFPAA